MKRFWWVMVFISLISIAFSDSPVTSTPFYQAYLDLKAVQQCTNDGILTSKISAVLADPEQDLDIKMAMINALSWDINGKDNTTKYLDYVSDYRDIYDDLFNSEWLPHDYLVIGYLLLMDDYFHVKEALHWLDEGVKQNPRSLTAHIIRAIGHGQNFMDNSEDWPKVWKTFEDAVLSEDLDMDIREPAVNIIEEYLILYR